MGEARLYASLPLKIRPRLLERTIDLHEGELFTVEAQNRTLTALNRLGIFRSGKPECGPRYAAGRRTLVGIDARFEIRSKCRSRRTLPPSRTAFSGPVSRSKASHNNLFRGGEVLSLKSTEPMSGRRETRTPGGRSSQLNSYELGLNASLDIPRLQLPRFLSGRRRYDRTTSLSAGVRSDEPARFLPPGSLQCLRPATPSAPRRTAAMP